MLSLKRFVPVLAVVLLLSANLAGAAAAEKAKSYSFSLASAAKVGNQVLTRGDYKVKLEGANAIFTKENTRATVTAPGKLETGKEKFDRTIIHQINDAGQPRITSIELGGTNGLLKLD